MPAPTGTNRRRFSSHLLNRDVRLRLVLDDLAFALIASLTAIGILYFLSNREIGDSLYSAHVSIKETRELLHNGVRVAGIVTFLAVLAFGFWSLLDAHRIAGPMHRLRRLLDEVANGDLTHEIRFRKKDEFQDVAAAADRVVDRFEETIRAIKLQVSNLQEQVEAMPNSASETSSVRESLAKLSADLEFFKLPADSGAPVVDNSPLT